MTQAPAHTPTLTNDDTLYVQFHGGYKVEHRNSKTGEIERLEVDHIPDKSFVFHHRYDKMSSIAGMKPGETRMLPFEFVSTYFGDPRSGPERLKIKDSEGAVIRIPTRPEELKRIAVIYGVYTRQDLLPEYVPNVTITTMDGEEVFTPAVDPEGVFVYGHVSDNEQSHDVATILSNLQRRINELEKQAAAYEAIGPDDDIPVDGPPMPIGGVTGPRV